MRHIPIQVTPHQIILCSTEFDRERFKRQDGIHPLFVINIARIYSIFPHVTHGFGEQSKFINVQYPQNDIQNKDQDKVYGDLPKGKGVFITTSIVTACQKRDWDFGNKGPGPRCSFFVNHQSVLERFPKEEGFQIQGASKTFLDHHSHRDFGELRPWRLFAFCQQSLWPENAYCSQPSGLY